MILERNNQYLPLYDINQKKLIRTCSPNVHINTIFDTIELIGFSGDNIYLNTNIWNKKENRNEFCTCKINIHTNKQEKYDLYLNSINTSGTYGLVEPSFDLLTTYNLTSKKIIFQKKMLPSETCCWLNDDTFILTPFDLQVEGRKLKYTDLKIMAQKIKGEITCEHEIDPVKNNLIKILSSMNNGTHVLSSNQTGVVQSWNMTLQEQPQTIVNLKERAWELKTMTNSELTAALLAERIVLFDPHQTNQTYRPSQESSCIIN